MPRKPNIERPVALCLWLPEGLRTKLDLVLWSDAQQCVPRGAYTKFFVGLLTDYLDRLKDD